LNGLGHTEQFHSPRDFTLAYQGVAGVPHTAHADGQAMFAPGYEVCGIAPTLRMNASASAGST
jgi:hypothetical protein